MRFETKFNLGESIWFMKDNVPTEAIVSAINIFHVGTNQDSIKYCAKKIVSSVSWLDYQHLFEGSLFTTKGELLKSLFGSDRICKGENCDAINGVGHSDECIAQHNICCSG